jgi:hypothetical protein
MRMWTRLLGILGLAGCGAPVSPSAIPATMPEVVRADGLTDVLAKALDSRGMWSGFRGWHIEGRTRPSFVRVVEGTAQTVDRSFLRVTVVDLEGTMVMDAAGDLQRPLVPEGSTLGFKKARIDIHGARTLYRLNPPGGYFGGTLKVFVGDRFIVVGEGDRLPLESVEGYLAPVVHAVDTFAAGRPLADHSPI